MISENGGFICDFSNCGRKFPDQKKYQEHMKRRHMRQEEELKLPSLSGIRPMINKQQNQSITNLNQNQIENMQGQPKRELSSGGVKNRKNSLQKASQQQTHQQQQKFQKLENQIQQLRQEGKKHTINTSQELQNISNSIAKKCIPSTLSRPLKKGTQKPLFSSSTNNNNNSQLMQVKQENETIQEQKIQQQLQQQSSSSNLSEEVKKSVILEQDWKTKLKYMSDKMGIELQQPLKDYGGVGGAKSKYETSEGSEEKELTEKMALQFGGESSLSEIEVLILRDQGIGKVHDSLPVNNFNNLKMLSLSHNKLKSVDKICDLYFLQELNLNFNKIKDISALGKLVNLEKLYATNNIINSLAGIDGCKELQLLCVYKNVIKDFNSMLLVIGDLPFLENFDIEENPVNKERADPLKEILNVLNQNKVQLSHFNGKQLGVKKPNSNYNQDEETAMLRSFVIQGENNSNNNNDFGRTSNFQSYSQNPSQIMQKSNAFNKTQQSFIMFNKQQIEESDYVQSLQQELVELKEDKEELLLNYDELVEELKQAQDVSERYENKYKKYYDENLELKVKVEQLELNLTLMEKQQKHQQQQKQQQQQDSSSEKSNEDLETKQQQQNKGSHQSESDYILQLKKQLLYLQEENMELKFQVRFGQNIEDNDNDAIEKTLEDYEKQLQDVHKSLGK